VFFTIDDPTKYLLKKVFEDSREINIKSSYDSSEEYNQQAKLINTKLANFPKQFKEFTDSIFAILILIFVSGCLLILQHREELERALKEKDGDILKLLEDRDTLIKIFKSSPSKESPKDSADK
jgi:cell division protein ZapA (FtsZ GTPase activity inhibitor)